MSERRALLAKRDLEHARLRSGIDKLRVGLSHAEFLTIGRMQVIGRFQASRGETAKLINCGR